jgi:hypothetical protein
MNFARMNHANEPTCFFCVIFKRRAHEMQQHNKRGSAFFAARSVNPPG